MTEVTTESPRENKAIDAMDARRVFANPTDAAAYIAKCQTDITDFGDHPIAAAGFTDEGDFDPEIYNEAMEVAVARLTERGEGTGSSTVKAIVIYPSPAIENVWDSPEGREWLKGIMQKELNHVAVRQLRKAKTVDEINEAIEAMPTTLAEYITSGRETSGGILAAYNDLWQIIKKAMGKKSKQFGLANLSKKELRKAMESASYAKTIYPHLEDRQNKAGENESYFEIAATFGVMLAKQNGLDPTIFERMLSNRDEKEIDVDADDEDEEDFDLEAMAAELKKPTADAPADESTGDEQPANETEDGEGES